MRWDTVIQTQLGLCEDDSCIIIKLTPRKHQISVNDIAPDSVNESTAPLHNYICKENIQITEEDIVCENYKCGNLDNLPQTIITPLTDYHRKSIPDISILDICGY